MNGVLVVDKPSGPTSHDVVARLRRAMRFQRIGHTGTLDPIATGVLPMVVGRATRLAQFFTAMPKQYLATLLLGRMTDTYDVTGSVEGATPPPRLSRADVEPAIAVFRGTYSQAAPPFSARKIAGTPGYVLARRKQRVEPRSRSVTVERLDLVNIEEERVVLRVRCSAGFYVRSLAHELGQHLGCGACLEALRREESGGYGLQDATALDVLEREGLDGTSRIVSIDRLLTSLPGLVLSMRGSGRAAHGNALSPDDLETPAGALGFGASASGPVRLLDPGGGLVGLAEVDAAGTLHPRIVLV